MKRMLGSMLLGMIAAFAVAYVGDWAVWRVRVAMGGGMSTVQVGTLIVTPLKGNKEEYDWGGVQSLDCSESLFPQAGSGACWWLARKGVVYER